MATRILVVDDSPTIRHIVSTLLERNGYEPQVASDGEDAYEALASGEVEADLVLLDFVMPRMNGFQFCRALRANERLAKTPVVLMSAKGDKIRDQFVEQTGALDAITKPFDAQALVAVVENALRKLANQRSSVERLPDFEADDLASTDERPLRREPELTTRRTHVAQVIAQKLAAIAARAAMDRPEIVGRPAFTDAIVERLSNEAIVEMIETIGDLDRDEAGGALLAGDLGIVPIGAVLQLLQAESQTGVLVCKRDAFEVRATFREGEIDLVQSSGAGDEFRLGRFFVEEGILEPREIEEMTARTVVPAEPLLPTSTEEVEAPRSTVQPKESQKPVPLGMALMKAGKVDAEQLERALTRQSSELLYEVLRWSYGRFELRREAPSELAQNARLGMPVASVVMEGFRRVDEWRAIERSLGSFDTVLLRDDAAFGRLDKASLPPRERQVLDAVDGERTVRAIAAAGFMSTFDVCRIVVQFLEARVLRRRA
ncbi:MAG: response regulator [Labilithrix sp.]|nr:response regulator [Labilithrix sp.]MCW5810552.1 response regulator [Labilithrix sp.]